MRYILVVLYVTLGQLSVKGVPLEDPDGFCATDGLEKYGIELMNREVVLRYNTLCFTRQLACKLPQVR